MDDSGLNKVANGIKELGMNGTYTDNKSSSNSKEVACIDDENQKLKRELLRTLSARRTNLRSINMGRRVEITQNTSKACLIQ